MKKHLSLFIIILLFPLTLFIGLTRIEGASAATFPNPHGNYTSDTYMCDRCHSGHNGFYGGILDAITQRQTCYTCHDGSASNFNVKAQFGETTVGSSVYASYHPVPTGSQLCTDCHDPHFSPSDKPRILSVAAQAYSSGNAVCAACHGSGSALPGGDMLTPFTGTAHDTEMNNPSSGTQIKCARCHGPHGSPYYDIIRTTIEDVYGTPRTVTGNNNTVCFGCHTDKTGNYFGQSIYEQAQHGPGTTTITETTQAHFSTGTLTTLSSLPSGELTLGGNPGLAFDGVDDTLNLASGFTTVQNTFTYEFWAKPGATHEIDTESTTATTGTAGQKYAIGAQFGPSGSLAGAGVSIGTNGVSVYEHASGYMPPLLVYSGNINGWVHVAVVYNNKKPYLYINGELKKIGLTSPKVPFPSNTFGYGTYGSFSGSLDDIRIWNYARSQAQIKSDMYKELGGSETGLIGYWKLNEGSGTTANNSAAANNGTISGALWNQYSASGNRLSGELALPAVTAHGAQIKWNAVTPTSTALTVETNLYQGGSWKGWQTVSNGATIPGIVYGTNLTGGKIQYRVSMTTANTSVSPRLQDVSIRISHSSGKSKSTYPGTSYPASQCMNCHEPHGKTGISYYRRADGNTLCTNCHDDASVTRPDNYSYQGITAYNTTPHSAMGPIPNPLLYTNPAMPAGYCVICHNPHGKNDDTGTAIPKQLQLAQEQLCFGGGSGCHSDPANSTVGVSIQNRFTAGSNPTARHSVALAEQSIQDTSIKCANCHNPHLNTGTAKIVDPTNPDTIYNFADTSLLDYVSGSGEIYLLAKAKHDGLPPVITSGPTVASMTATSCVLSWATNEVTTGIVYRGSDTSLGGTPINSTAKTSHSVTLSGLTLFQNHYYKVKALDALGNYVETATVAVDSTAPTITSGPTPANPVSGGLDMNWVTNETSNSWVDYTTSVDYAVYGWAYKMTRGNDTLTTSHSVYLDNLSTTPGTEYTFQVRSMDMRGNERVSPLSIFKMSSAPPAPTLVPEEDHLDYEYTTTATLYWNSVTDPDGDSVQYYVQISTDSTFASGVTNSGWISGTNWNVSISNNEQATWYWRVKARDQWGFESGWSTPVDAFIHEGYYEPVPSCPILYTWNGEKFEFITDIVAGSNVGLKLGPDKYKIPTPDEHITIPGYLLREKDNLYTIKVKNERDEIDFIDNLVLEAIDHPEGTSIGLNDFHRDAEPYKLFTYDNNLKPVKKATYVLNPTYSGGKPTKPIDITSLVSKIDNKHAAGELFDDNQFTFDLGDLREADNVKLVIKGWTKFADGPERAERVAKAKQGNGMAPRLLEVLQPNGEWKSEVIMHIAGHTKTAIIDLTGKFPKGSKQFIVRLRGMYRPNFDFVGVDTSINAPMKTTSLKLKSADLNYRGLAYFTDVPAPYHDYYALADQRLIHEGRFTKYGNVMPLVQKIDDKLVVMDSGDELTLNFEALPPPAKGMTRSFVVKPWAYYKELEAAKVEPMPFTNMVFDDYPASLGEYPEELKTYVEEWNTRIHEPGKAEPAFWDKLQKFFERVLKNLNRAWEETLVKEATQVEGNTETTTNAVSQQASIYQPVNVADFQKHHYSINTDYVVLRADNTVSETEYTMNSAGSGMWQSASEPTPGSPGTDSIANKSKVTTSDNNRWDTENYPTPNQDDGRFNYQMYKFVISTPPRQSIYSYKIFWEGYGEPTTGYNVSLSLWNFTQSRWDEFRNQLVPGETTMTVQKSKDYKDYCLKCHGGTVPSGVKLGPHTRNIATTYPNDYHGGFTGTDDSGSTIKPTYSRGISVPCVDCHDLHGSQNAYHLRENVNGTAGLNVPDMTATSKYDTSKNTATLSYCQSCHAGTLDTYHWAKCLYCHRDPGVHDCSPPPAGDFSRSCTYCHTHGGSFPPHGRFDGDCHCGTTVATKAF